MFVLVVDPNPSRRTVAYGPFRTAARASGEGLNRFGPLTFGNPDKWRVVPLSSGEK